MILDEKLIEETAEEIRLASIEENSLHKLINYKAAALMEKQSFKAGVEWAESQMEELAIEFVKYKSNNGWVSFDGINCIKLVELNKAESSVERIDLIELFQQFLKERYESNK